MPCDQLLVRFVQQRVVIRRSGHPVTIGFILDYAELVTESELDLAEDIRPETEGIVGEGERLLVAGPGVRDVRAAR